MMYTMYVVVHITDAAVERAVRDVTVNMDESRNDAVETADADALDGLGLFFSSRRRHTRLQGDWSSDVCSSDLRAGHERVLRARFADAQFFWQSDQKCRLADYLPKLERVTYESRLGSYRDKVERIRTIGRWFTENWFNLGMVLAHVAEADRAAELAKCDLATEMVREFTELQGIVGGLYARAQGESDEIADAIYDHYRPVGLDDPIPRNLTGCAVALADKLDSVVGCFAVAVIPTGSSDPYALRRAALGIVKIILEKKLPVSLSLAIGAASKALLTHKPKRGVTPDQETQILDFILDRAKFVFREREGFGYDEVSAVFRAGADRSEEHTSELQSPCNL